MDGLPRIKCILWNWAPWSTSRFRDLKVEEGKRIHNSIILRFFSRHYSAQHWTQQIKQTNQEYRALWEPVSSSHTNYDDKGNCGVKMCQHCPHSFNMPQTSQKKSSFKTFDSSSTFLNTAIIYNWILNSHQQGRWWGEKGASIFEHLCARYSTYAVLLSGYPWCRHNYLHFREKKMETFV